MRFRRWSCALCAVSLVVLTAARATAEEHTVRNNPGMMAAGVVVGGLGMLMAGLGSWQVVEGMTADCPPRETNCISGLGNSRPASVDIIS